jgi:hypothetical protein
MNYKGQKLSDNLTQSQRDMFKYMIRSTGIVSMTLLKCIYAIHLKDDYFRKKAEPYVEE